MAAKQVWAYISLGAVLAGIAMALALDMLVMAQP